jgi:hypothetical protein
MKISLTDSVLLNHWLVLVKYYHNHRTVSVCVSGYDKRDYGSNFMNM